MTEAQLFFLLGWFGCIVVALWSIAVFRFYEAVIGPRLFPRLYALREWVASTEGETP